MPRKGGFQPVERSVSALAVEFTTNPGAASFALEQSEAVPKELRNVHRCKPDKLELLRFSSWFHLRLKQLVAEK